MYGVTQLSVTEDISLITFPRVSADLAFVTEVFELLEEGDLASDVLKVPHHGGYEALSSAFFQAVSPEYAVITSDAENPEDETVVHILSSLGATVYLTRLGSVTMVSDGENLDVSQAAFSEQ